MCGIVICHVPEGSEARHVLAMNQRLRHRGPDGEGYALFQGSEVAALSGPDTSAAVCRSTELRLQGDIRERLDVRHELALAQRRLAIVDLSPGGHQPMRHPSGLWAVFNGEIYNHVELRVELEGLGHRFRSHSDTEVLLAAYAQWGEEALSRCNGMWALVIYDPARRELFIARDRFGVKPLYYWQGARGELLLASEIKALLAHPLLSAVEPDLEACECFLTHGPREWETSTLFRGVRRFPAGHWARYHLDRSVLQARPYWSWPEAPASDVVFNAAHGRELAEQYLALLDDAVGLRLRADVRVGTALSGGLDSSSVACLVNQRLRAQQVPQQQQVFSSVYLDPAYSDSDESRFIAQVAEQLQVRSSTIEARWQDLAREHERMIWALDTPPANTLMSSWHTYRLVAESGVTVTLDGQGADEQLAGYARYARNQLLNSPWPVALREAWRSHRSMTGLGPQLLSGVLLKGLTSVGGLSLAQAAVKVLRMGSQPLHSVDQALRADFSGPLANLIHYADKTSMAWSVESRMPFMDYRLVEWLAQVPATYKLHEGWTKWLARQAMTPHLPDSIVWRRDKLGWPIPENQWFSGPLREWLTSEVAASAFVQEISARARIRPGLPGRLRQLNLATWHRLYFEEQGRGGRALGRDPQVWKLPSALSSQSEKGHS